MDRRAHQKGPQLNCTACDTATSVGLHLCDKCHTRLRGLLQRVPDTITTAQETLANQSNFGHPEGSSGTKDAPPAPINLDMSHRLTEYENSLISLAGWVNETLESWHPRRFIRARNAAEYLHAMTGKIRQHPQAGDLYLELAGLERRVLSAADRPLVKRPLGECGALDLDEDGTVTKCDGIVEGHETATTGRCRKCHREHDLTDRITSKLAAAMNYRASLQRIVTVLNNAGFQVNYERAKKWVQRGKLAPSCDLSTRSEGHTPAEVLTVFQKMSS